MRIITKVLLATISGITAILIIIPALLIRATPDTRIRVNSQHCRTLNVLFN